MLVSVTATTPEELLERFGLQTFRPGQREAVVAALEGRDSLVGMPTGAGKSLCYQLPALAVGSGLVVVVSPLIALMVDQWRKLQRSGVPAVMLASGMPDDHNAQALQDIRTGHARLLLATPERFGSRAFAAALHTRRVTLFAVDEAHCIVEWGHDFRGDYLRLGEAIAAVGRPPVMALTATATPLVTQEIATRLGLRDWVEVRSGFDRPNLTFDVVYAQGDRASARKQAALLHVLDEALDGGVSQPAIVYCGTRRETEQVTVLLRGHGIATVGYHAGMPAAHRQASQRAFMDDTVDVVVATSAFGMGIDKADVRTVVHCVIPTSLETYYQEVGRAGRDGLPARALLLAARVDLGRLIHFNTDRRGAGRDRGWESYRTIERFVFNASVCRRRQILEYFGDQQTGAPTGRCCDVCEADERLREAIGEAPANTERVAQTVEHSGFERLREWRRERAKGKPAYVVAVNAVLEEVLRIRPKSIDELLTVRGIGPVFCEKHGESLLGVLSEIDSSLTVKTGLDELPSLMRLANEAIEDVLGVGGGER